MRSPFLPAAALLVALGACQAEYAGEGSPSSPAAVARAAARADTDTWRARVTGL